MFQWVIENLIIAERNFMTQKHIVIISFNESDFSAMYHFPLPQCKYNKQFVDKFMSNIDHASESIREWRRYPNKNDYEEKGMYAFDSLTGPYC